jgi:hypothetical protein
MMLSAYPRSGQTFTRYALKQLYGSDLPKWNHSVKFLKENFDSKTESFVIFRNPLDSVSSWHAFQIKNIGLQTTLALDVAYWKRYYTYVLEHPEYIKLLDFNKITDNLDYLVEKVNKAPKSNILVESIYAEMSSKSLESTHLPSDTRNIFISDIKTKIVDMPEFQELTKLYEELQKLEVSQSIDHGVTR